MRRHRATRLAARLFASIAKISPTNSLTLVSSFFDTASRSRDESRGTELSAISHRCEREREREASERERERGERANE